MTNIKGVDDMVFKFFTSIFKQQEQRSTVCEQVPHSNSSEVDTYELIKMSTSEYNKGNVTEAIDILKNVVNLNKYDLNSNLKMCAYMYKSNRGDESWEILNQLTLDYALDFIATVQIEDTKRKQLIFENKNQLDILEVMIRVQVYRDRSGLIQNLEYRDNHFKFDIKWDNDTKFKKHAIKANVNWSILKEILVQEYDSYISSKTKNEVIFKSQSILDKVREYLLSCR